VHFVDGTTGFARIVYFQVFGLIGDVTTEVWTPQLAGMFRTLGFPIIAIFPPQCEHHFAAHTAITEDTEKADFFVVSHASTVPASGCERIGGEGRHHFGCFPKPT
jgi:hypothetical protein